MSQPTHSPEELLSTGIPGLDVVLGGGLSPHRIYLVEGEPGTGKTTTGLQFLREGLARGEPVVYITLAESGDELRAVAASHGDVIPVLLATLSRAFAIPQPRHVGRLRRPRQPSWADA